MYGVTIGEKHTYTDFGLIYATKTISPPNPQIKRIAVPLRNGAIDITESLTDEVKYDDRDIKIEFYITDPISKWSSKVSEIENYLHGKKMKIIFDDDAAFYYIGRVYVESFSVDGNLGKLIMKCTTEPYKYDVLSSADDWEWDKFDFEEGYITNAYEVIVSGSAAMEIYGRCKKACPTIITDSEMTVTYNGVTYNLVAGTQKIYELILEEGVNVLEFTGNGIVTVDYRGGSL